MTPTEFLRAMAGRQRKPTPHQVFQQRVTEHNRILYEGTTAILKAMGASPWRRAATYRCGCWPQYTDCYCLEDVRPLRGRGDP